MQYPPGDETADALRDALSSSTRRVHARVEFDWDRDGKYNHPFSDLSSVTQSAEDDRQVTGDIPEEVNTLVGYSSAELTLKLAGSRRHGEIPAHQFFSPYWNLSPIYGKDIVGTPIRYSRVVSTVIGDVAVRQFTGWIREFRLEREDNVVTIVASDVLDLVNSPVTLPRWARFTNADQQGASTRPIELGWVVEEAFRQAGAPSGPKEHPSAVAYWSCNGSFLPSVGTTNDATSDMNYTHGIRWQNVPAFRNGVYGLEAAPGQYPYVDENAARRNVGMSISPKPIRLPVDGGPSNLTVGFSAWVRLEPGYVRQSPANSRFPTRDRYLNSRIWLNIPLQHPLNRLVTAPADPYEYRMKFIESNILPNGEIHIMGLELNESIGVFERFRYHGQVPNPQDHHYVDIRVTTDGVTANPQAWVDGYPISLSSKVSQTSWTDWRQLYSIWYGDGIHELAGLNGNAELRRNTSTIYTSMACSHVQIYAGPTDEVEAGDAQFDREGHPPLREGRPLSVLSAGSHADLTWIPPTIKVHAWDLLQDLCSAELAVLHTDEFGTRYFIPNYQARDLRRQALSLADSRGLLINDDRLLSLMVNPTIDQYRNRVTIGYNERWAQYGSVWEPEDWRLYQTPDNTNVVQDISLDDSVISVHTGGFSNVGGYSKDVNYQPSANPHENMIRAVLSANSSTYVTSNWTFRFGIPSDGSAHFTWRKYTSGIRQAFGGPDGVIQFTSGPILYTGVDDARFNNNLWMVGWKYGTSDSGIVTVSNDAEIAKRGVREITLPDNQWRSWKGGPNFGDGTYGIAESLIRDLVTPAPVIDGVRIPADPRLQLRDVVALTSEGGITGRIHAEIVGIHRTDTADTSEDRLTLRVIDTPDQWQLGVPGLSELGTTTTLA